MIIRIMHEGQYDVPHDTVDGLNVLDDQLVTALDADDTEAFTRVLTDLLTAVRDAGTPLPDDALVPSELVLPAVGTEPGQVRALLRDDGLIPG